MNIFANTQKTASRSYFKEALLLWNNLEKHFPSFYSRNIAQCTLDISPKIPKHKMQNICIKGKRDEWKLGGLQLLMIWNYLTLSKCDKKESFTMYQWSWLRRERERRWFWIKKNVIKLNDLDRNVNVRMWMWEHESVKVRACEVWKWLRRERGWFW